MEVEKASHCKYQIRYHIVWGVKYAHRVLFGERVAFLAKILQEIAERYDYKVERVGADANHIHIFAGAHPEIAPAKLIQVLKSISARKMFEKYPEIKKFLWGGNLWSIGYYVRTISDGPIEPIVKKYIEDQNNKVNKSKTPKTYQLKLVPQETTTALAPWGCIL